MADIRGLIDSVEGSYLSGWAYDQSAPNRTCKITVLDENDAIVAQGRASRQRPDLAVLGHGRTDFAFRVLLPSITSATQLSVRADDFPLANSPIKLGPAIFDGDASLKDGVVAGWVTERISGFSPPFIEIVDQDLRVIATAQASFDNVIADQNYSPARFKVDVPNWAFNNKSLHLTVSANGVAFARCDSMLRLIGYIDQVSPHRCAGWLYSPDAPHRQFAIAVYTEGKLVGSGPCNVARHDITSVHPMAFAAGFDFALSLADRPEFKHLLSFRLLDSDHEIFDGPILAVTRPGFVQLAREISTRARKSGETHLRPEPLALLQSGVHAMLKTARETDQFHLVPIKAPLEDRPTHIRLTIVVPVYRGVAETRACIESVLATRNADSDRLIIVADKPPEPQMLPILGYFATKPNVILLVNDQNLGFIKSVNRGLEFCLSGDVLLLNSDTKMFPGALDELAAVMHSAADIGIVTAMSNNATIFSYPHPSRRGRDLTDSSWDELAAVAAASNKGMVIDVPTGHGFCMLIRHTVLYQVGLLDEVFGRGYGEENDFCQRAADLGYRSVAACGALVEHRESVSFTSEKADLLRTNLRILEGRYPEYTPTIMAFERTDPLRNARRALDLYRVAKAAGTFLVVIEAWFGGGSRKAAADITERALGPGQCTITVRCLREGGVEVTIAEPVIQALFDPSEGADLIALLDAAKPVGVFVHQVLGYDAAIIEALVGWLGRVPSVFYGHDFYAICPRVTMIDAVNEFCGAASTETCERCLELGGQHEHSRSQDLTASEHRDLFGRLLRAVRQVVTPSEDTARWIRRIHPSLAITAIPHPSTSGVGATTMRSGSRSNFTLVGAIGHHKGSALLLDIARHARLKYPALHFTVLGYTDRDEALKQIGNVSISGPYKNGELLDLVDMTDSCAALFLHNWPETFSYTLTEVAELGLMPIVPDIGAPVDRVRAADFGIVYPFPASPLEVLRILASFSDGFMGPGSGRPQDLVPVAQSDNFMGGPLGISPSYNDGI